MNENKKGVKELRVQSADIILFGSECNVVPSQTLWSKVVGPDNCYALRCRLPIGERGCVVDALPQIVGRAFGGELLIELDRLHADGANLVLRMNFEKLSKDFSWLGIGLPIKSLLRRQKEICCRFPAKERSATDWQISFTLEFLSFVVEHGLMVG